MFKQLIKDKELTPLFETINDFHDSVGVVVGSLNQGGRSLLSKRLTRELGVNLAEYNSEKGENKSIMVFDGETVFSQLIRQLTTEISPIRFDLVSTPTAAFATAECFLDLLKHNLDVIDHEVGFVLIDVSELWNLLGNGKGLTETELWKGLEEVLLDNGISFIITNSVTVEYKVDRQSRYNVEEHVYAALEVEEFGNRNSPRFFPVSCGIHFEPDPHGEEGTENENQFGELVVVTTCDIFHFKCAELFEEMGFDT